MQEEQTMSFEERLRQVQELTAKIESGALPLEDSMKEYERGMKILLDLDGELKDMTRRLTELRGTEQTEEPYAKV